jgi:hypothetical protein
VLSRGVAFHRADSSLGTPYILRYCQHPGPVFKSCQPHCLNKYDWFSRRLHGARIKQKRKASTSKLVAKRRERRDGPKEHVQQPKLETGLRSSSVDQDISNDIQTERYSASADV